MQDIILLRALDLSYAKEPAKFSERMLGREKGLVLKDVTFHLYKGEVLGILSDYKTLYYLKEIVNGSLDAKKGNVKTTSAILSLDVMDHTHHPHALKTFATELLDEYMMHQKEMEAATRALLELPLFRKYWNTPVKDLSRREIAIVLIELSKHAKAEIIIYCNMYRHFKGQDAENFKATINSQERSERGILLLESDIEPVRTLANYFLWLSYGQIRYDGSVKKGVQEYAQYQKQRSQLKSVDEEALFDLEWKRDVSEYAHYEHGLKRLSKNQASPIDKFNIRKIIISLVLVFTMMMASIVIFMDISFTGAQSAGQEQTVTMPEEENERITYAVNTEEGLELGGDLIPYMGLVQVSDRNEETVTITEGDGAHEVDAGSVIYFNPASLYPETTLEALLPYTGEVFRNNYQYYSAFLNVASDTVFERMNFSSSSDRHAAVSGIPITYHIENGYTFAMSFPAADVDGLHDDFGIASEDVIFRLPEGYMILDGSNDTWLYINR